MEAFSDGVFSIAVTLLVLEFRILPAPDLRTALLKLGSSYLAYVLSFATIAIYWRLRQGGGPYITVGCQGANASDLRGDVLLLALRRGTGLLRERARETASARTKRKSVTFGDTIPRCT